jgi:hypothetical protein
VQVEPLQLVTLVYQIDCLSDMEGNGTQFIADPSNNYSITISVDIGFTFLYENGHMTLIK